MPLWVICCRFGRDRLSTNVRFASIPTVNSGLWDLSRCAMCGRLRVDKDFLHVCGIGRCSHVFGLLDAVHMTAGHNALRGSGPGQNLAFDNAVAHVGCPDRRIDRLCITRCSPCQPPYTPLSAYLVYAASATGSL